MKGFLMCMLFIVCVEVAVVHGAEPDPSSFQNSLTSFLNSLFGKDDNSTALPPTPTTPSQFDNPATSTQLPDQSDTSNKTTETQVNITDKTTGIQQIAASNKTTLPVEQTNATQTITQASNQTATKQTDSGTALETSPNNSGTIQTGAEQTGTVKTVTDSPVFSGTFLSSTFSWSSTSSYSPFPSEYEDETNNVCYEDTSIQNFCSAPSVLTDVSFWDLYSAIFSDSVVDGLMMGCPKGEWCLTDKYDYWDALIAERVDIVMKSDIVEAMCESGVLGCLDNMAVFFKNCSFYNQMVFTSESLDLVCNMKKNDELSNECYKHVIEALHVTLADLVRENTEDYAEKRSDETCDTAEAHMTQGLICIANSCPGESETFKSFKPWKWFTNIVDELITECDYNITECVALLQKQWRNQRNKAYYQRTKMGKRLVKASVMRITMKPQGYVEPEELQMMIFISTATMVSAIVLSLSVCLCYRRYRRNVVLKDGYQRLLNEGDES